MLKILYEDNHIIVVVKPVGVLSQADGTNADDMLNIIKAYLKEKYNKPGNVFLGLVHRLDRNVGGVMVFAKTSKAASRLSDQIRRRVVDKEYYAVLWGQLEKKEDVLVDYLFKDKEQNFVKVSSKANKLAKKCELSYKVLGNDDKHSLVKVKLITGRAHQIRVQFSSRGCALIGDRKYGKRNQRGEIALWAFSIAFLHPTKKERMEFCALPENKGAFGGLYNAIQDTCGK